MEYNKVFTLPNGEEIKVLDSYHGRFVAIPIQRIYKDTDMQDKNQLMSEEWANCDCLKIEKHKELFNIENEKSFSVIDTIVLAEDKNWIEYPTVNYYDEQCSNTKATTKVEIILQSEECSRRLFKEWSGNTNCYDMMQNITSDLWEDLCEGKHDAKYDEEEEFVELQFYTNEGESTWLEIEKEWGLEKMIISVRVIEFKNEIIE